MMAKSKPINVITPVEFADVSTVSKYDLPKAKSGVKYIDADNMDELVRLLHEEAKVI
jgi:electron transfer flavoprotein beta subunit